MTSLNFDNRIRPSVSEVFQGDGAYRCERDLHHHLTILFNGHSPLRLSDKSDPVAEYEHPTIARYAWSKKKKKSGSIDIYFLPRLTPADYATGEGGIAIEVNCDYNSLKKIKQDFIKLIDPVNGYNESVYIAFGRTFDFARAVVDGLKEAFAWCSRERPAFSLGTDLHAFIIAEFAGVRTLSEIVGNGAARADQCPLTQLDVRDVLGTVDLSLDPTAVVTKSEARNLLQREMQRAGIPLKSTTARCMFEETTTKGGHKKCHFGKTPLWDHHITKIGDSVNMAELTRWIRRLTESGQRHQGR
jgi:hypothetical protein